jgi:transcriptional repressor NrdR
MVMERLREIDEIAYVRFASVYRSFKDVAEMRAEIEDFLAHPSTTRRLPGRRPRPGEDGGAELALDLGK